jgi:alpha-L-rhamnosidase
MSTALYFGLVAPGNRKRVADNLAESLRNDHYTIRIGCLGSKFLLRALADNGHMDVAYKIITKESSPGWGFLAASNLSTLSESLDGSGSDNHVFMGDISAWMMTYLAGIRHDPAHPGFQRFLIQPETLGDLQWVKAHHDSPFGRIKSEWKKEGQTFTLEISVPVNSVAKVTIPAQTAEMVTESGDPVTRAEGIKFLYAKNGKAVFEAGSGSYHFISNLKPQ